MPSWAIWQVDTVVTVLSGKLVEGMQYGILIEQTA
jgi:hypothetical protein